jgi:hypothetical protein
MEWTPGRCHLVIMRARDEGTISCRGAFVNGQESDSRFGQRGGGAGADVLRLIDDHSCGVIEVM